MAKNDVWKKFVEKYCNDEKFRKGFDAIVVDDGNTPDVKVPEKDMKKMKKEA